MPSPRSESGPQAFWAALDQAKARDRAQDGQDRHTFGALIDLYLSQPAYKKLADLTKRDYDRHLRTIRQD